MILRYLIVENFGVFKGTHRFDLAPKLNGGKPRPIILFGGKNGAGKTSIFEAIRICLYGPKAFQGVKSQKDIQGYMLSKLHKNGSGVHENSTTRMELEFEYSQVGEKSSYLVSRTWCPSSKGVTENLSIKRNGQDIDDLDRSCWQEFLLELIPPGLTQLFFFDGEKIQRLAEEESETDELASSIKSLLGLDIVERLQADFKIYSSKSEFWEKEDSLHQELVDLSSQMDKLCEEKTQLRQELGGLETLLGYGAKKINDLESEFLSQGGDFARRRQSLIEQKAKLQEATVRLESELRDLCAGILPLSLTPHLCSQLANSLRSEADELSYEDSKKIKQQIIQKIERRLLKVEFWENLDIRITPVERSKICESLKDILDKEHSGYSSGVTSSIHNFTNTTRQRVISWAEQAGDEGPRKAIEISVELEQVNRQLHNVIRDLERIPEESKIQPLLNSIQSESEERGALEQKKKILVEKVSKMEYLIREKEREEKKLRGRISRSGKVDTKIQFLTRVNSVLGEYSTKLLKKKVAVLEESVTKAFRKLARKSDIVCSININPDTFQVTLEDKHGRQVSKEQLSAGEKQIYAISLLWGLGQSSGRPLPIMIDTPLGRLDSDHRSHLINRYFPVASHQVIIFSTDTEIDQKYLIELSSHVSHQYHLKYNDGEGFSKAEEGYFWSISNKVKLN